MTHGTLQEITGVVERLEKRGKRTRVRVRSNLLVGFGFTERLLKAMAHEELIKVSDAVADEVGWVAGETISSNTITTLFDPKRTVSIKTLLLVWVYLVHEFDVSVLQILKDSGKAELKGKLLWIKEIPEPAPSGKLSLDIGVEDLIAEEMKSDTSALDRELAGIKEHVDKLDVHPLRVWIGTKLLRKERERFRGLAVDKVTKRESDFLHEMLPHLFKGKADKIQSQLVNKQELQRKKVRVLAICGSKNWGKQHVARYFHANYRFAEGADSEITAVERIFIAPKKDLDSLKSTPMYTYIEEHAKAPGVRVRLATFDSIANVSEDLACRFTYDGLGIVMLFPEEGYEPQLAFAHVPSKKETDVEIGEFTDVEIGEFTDPGVLDVLYHELIVKLLKYEPVNNEIDTTADLETVMAKSLVSDE